MHIEHPPVQHTQGRDEPRLASPDTLGLWAFALGTSVGNLPDTGGVARAGLATCVAVFLGGGAQLLAGLQEYRTRSVFGATSFTVFGLFWITIGVTGWLTGTHLLPHTPPTTSPSAATSLAGRCSPSSSSAPPPP
ncbi:acetate uptake transporter [Streptomyces sp. NPDC096105]|uniref:acetate uptake transporter n=1 Tax=Streptomyces sp. NPDC096105 TaxID=3366074 RepID=UPI00380B0DBD